MKGYVPIQDVLYEVLTHPMLQSISMERAVSYAIQFAKVVGVPNQFDEKCEPLEVKDYRALLPCDFYEVKQVRQIDPARHKKGIPMRYSTDSFHMGEIKPERYEDTYKIQGRVIYTTLKDGLIEVSYMSIPVDEDGYPLIPDDETYKRALEAYIKKQWFTILYDMGKIRYHVLQNAQQEYAFCAAQARTNLIMPTVDQMEAISRSMNSFIQKTHEHQKGFVTLGDKQYIKNNAL